MKYIFLIALNCFVFGQDLCFCVEDTSKMEFLYMDNRSEWGVVSYKYKFPKVSKKDTSIVAYLSFYKDSGIKESESFFYGESIGALAIGIHRKWDVDGRCTSIEFYNAENKNVFFDLGHTDKVYLEEKKNVYHLNNNYLFELEYKEEPWIVDVESMTMFLSDIYSVRLDSSSYDLEYKIEYTKNNKYIETEILRIIQRNSWNIDSVNLKNIKIFSSINDSVQDYIKLINNEDAIFYSSSLKKQLELKCVKKESKLKCSCEDDYESEPIIFYFDVDKEFIYLYEAEGVDRKVLQRLYQLRKWRVVID